MLSDAWADPIERPNVERAVNGAKTKMQVIEVGALAIVAIYGMYLTTTGGKRDTEVVLRRAADGSFDLVKRTSYYGPSGPLFAITALFGKTPAQSNSSDG